MGCPVPSRPHRERVKRFHEGVEQLQISGHCEEARIKTHVMNHRLSMSARGWVLRQTLPTTALAVVTYMKARCGPFSGESLPYLKTTCDVCCMSGPHTITKVVLICPWGQAFHSCLRHCQSIDKCTATGFQRIYASCHVRSLEACIMNTGSKRRRRNEGTIVEQTPGAQTRSSRVPGRGLCR